MLLTDVAAVRRRDLHEARVAAGAADTTRVEPGIQFSLSPSTTPAPVARVPAPAPATAGVRAPPTRPAPGASSPVAASAGGNDERVAQSVRGLAVNGYRRAGVNSIVIVGGRAYHVGEMVDVRRSLRFARLRERGC